MRRQSKLIQQSNNLGIFIKTFTTPTDVIFSPCFFNFLSNPLFLRKVSLASDEERKITAVDGNSLKIRIKPNKEDMNKIVGFKISSFQLLKQTIRSGFNLHSLFLFCLLSETRLQLLQRYKTERLQFLKRYKTERQNQVLLLTIHLFQAGARSLLSLLLEDGSI